MSLPPSLKTAKKIPFFLWALVLGCAITAAQVAFAISLQSDVNLRGAYVHLYQWDSEHYDKIADEGYFANIPVFSEGTVLSKYSWVKNTNVAFFPGYPLLARAFLPFFWHKIAMVAAAQVAAVACWATFILLLRKLRVRPWIGVLAVIVTAAHPGAFFLIAAYSESLFLVGLFGMLLWMIDEKKHSWIGTGLLGSVMSATRVFGLPLALLPLIRAVSVHYPRWKSAATKRAVLKAAGTSLLVAAGGLAFFVYCHFAFGWWNLYFIRQKMGWNLEPQYFLLTRSSLKLLFTYDPPTSLRDGWEVARTITPITLWFLLAAFGLDAIVSYRKKDAGFRERFAFWAGAAILFYLPTAALITSGWQSMIRYAFPPVILSVIALAMLWSRFSLSRTWNAVLCVAVLTVAGLSFMEQGILIQVFTSGGWVS